MKDIIINHIMGTRTLDEYQDALNTYILLGKKFGYLTVQALIDKIKDQAELLDKAETQSLIEQYLTDCPSPEDSQDFI